MGTQGFVRKIAGVLTDHFLEPNADGSLNTVDRNYIWDGAAWVPDEALSTYSKIEDADDVVTTVDLSDPANLSIESVSASVGKTATTTVAIGATSLVITRSVA